MKKSSKKVLEGDSKKIIKKVPVVGLVFIYSDINDKGVVNGVCNNLLDACPILGWVKSFTTRGNIAFNIEWEKGTVGQIRVAQKSR